MSHESIEVYSIWSIKKKYLLVGLTLFHKLATDAESEESTIRDSPTETPIIPTAQYPIRLSLCFAPLISRSTIPHT